MNLAGSASAPPVLATYRLQLNREFTFQDAERVAPYLRRLGVTHLYLSPILRSRTGSTHGYDVVDPNQVDPELGGEAGLARLVATVRGLEMGIILDIVPNHMGIGPENPYWEDVFANGPASRYAGWFDIDWDTPQRGLAGRIMVPVLGASLDEVLARGEVTLAYEAGRFRVRYFEHRFPVDPGTIPLVLGMDHPRQEPGADPDIEVLVAALNRYLALPSRTMRRASAIARRQEMVQETRAEIARLVETSSTVRELVERRIREFSTGPGAPGRMKAFLDRQVYALTWWRRAGHEINYRRFFDINELVGLRMGDPTVFARTHERVLAAVADGTLQGLRIDHVDGLRDPAGYLERLRVAIEQRHPGEPGKRFPILVEKILSPGESLRRSWPVQGTTGYEFLNDLDAMLTDASGAARLERHYLEFVRRRDLEAGFHRLSVRSKIEVLRTSLRADVYRLGRLLGPVARDRLARTLHRDELTEALERVIAWLPVYRTYIRPEEDVLHPEDRSLILTTLERVRDHGGVAPDLLEFLRQVLLGELLDLRPDLETLRGRFIERWQQTSGPAAAKGVEDTALYRYLPLVSRNEVGAEPARDLTSAAATLHEANRERGTCWPAAMTTVETHDTKRSADVRARIMVLSEIPDRWAGLVRQWHSRNLAYRVRTRHGYAPDVNTEWMIYQTLAGMWPQAGPLPEDFSGRLTAYLTKAMREAKLRTSWTDPDEEFEAGVTRFIERLLEDERFTGDLGELVRDIGPAGAWNALSRIAVHFTSPGVPDLYQGSELWNPALVDPDNRRRVDYDLRIRHLDEIQQAKDPGAWRQDPADDRLKLRLIHRLLQVRREYPGVMQVGEYLAVPLQGERAAHGFAFLRREDQTLLTVVTRQPWRLAGREAPVGELWRDTALHPGIASGGWTSLLTGETVGPELRCAAVLRVLPVNVLVLRP